MTEDLGKFGRTTPDPGLAPEPWNQWQTVGTIEYDAPRDTYRVVDGEGRVVITDGPGCRLADRPIARLVREMKAATRNPYERMAVADEWDDAA